MTTAEVFVVDDNRLTRELLSDAVRESGYEPVAFGSARDVLTAIADRVPAACLVDQTMPGMSGADLVRALRTSGDDRIRRLPIIGVTGGVERELLDAGATACLRKPASQASVAGALQAVLRGGGARERATAPSAAASSIAEFRTMHQRARGGLLSGPDLALYRAMRTDLAHAFLAMQQIALPARSRARRALRVPVQFRADLQLGGQPVFAHTIDLGQGGFSAILATLPPVGAKISFRLQLREGEWVEGLVRVANSAPAGTSGHRVGFAFVGLDAEQLERVEMRVFDAVVEQLDAASPG